MKKKMLKILKDNVNLGGLAADVLDEALEPALQKVVDDSANPLDNALMSAFYPSLETFLKEEVEKAVNKLFSSLDDEQA